MLNLSRSLSLFGLLGLGMIAAAQSDQNAPIIVRSNNDDGPPQANRTIIRPRPNVIDLLLAIEGELGPALGLNSEAAWAPTYKALYYKHELDLKDDLLKSNDRVRLSFALGIKASDGVVALKARDIAALNKCAVQIEKLATLLEVPERCVQRANRVKHFANQQRWIDAFSELGRLQHEVLQYLEGNEEDGPVAGKESRKDDALLIVMGGWLESGRQFTSLVLDHYSDRSSNILREPRLVKMLSDEVNELRPAYKKHPVVQSMLTFLPEMHKKVDVGLHDPIPKADVQWMSQAFRQQVDQAVSVEQTSAPKAAAPNEAAPKAEAKPDDDTAKTTTDQKPLPPTAATPPAPSQPAPKPDPAVALPSPSPATPPATTERSTAVAKKAEEGPLVPTSEPTAPTKRAGNRLPWIFVVLLPLAAWVGLKSLKKKSSP